ncbi:hypothetical protein [Psychroflexus sp. MBR-150]|jgi:hypothetical protein
MPKLVIKRAKEWANGARNYRLYLNDKKIGKIGNGETEVIEIEPGSHKLQAKIDWCSSENINFEIEDNETYEVKLSSFMYSNWLFPMVLLITALYYAFDEELGLTYQFYFFAILPFGLYFLYFITFGRNRYLRFVKLK